MAKTKPTIQANWSFEKRIAYLMAERAKTLKQITPRQLLAKVFADHGIDAPARVHDACLMEFIGGKVVWKK